MTIKLDIFKVDTDVLVSYILITLTAQIINTAIFSNSYCVGMCVRERFKSYLVGRAGKMALWVKGWLHKPETQHPQKDRAQQGTALGDGDRQLPGAHWPISQISKFQA